MKGLLLTSILLTGCVSAIHTSSYEDKELKDEEIHAIAEDGARFMATKYPPGKTSLKLDKGGKFGEVFSDYLRQKGFALEINNGIPFSYIIDRVDNNSLRLALITANWRSDALYLENQGKFIRKDLTQRID